MTDALERATMALAADFPEASRADWMRAVESALKGADFEKKLVRRTYEGIAVQPLYTAEDAPGRSIAAGDADRIRSGWDVRQAHAHPDPSETSKAIRADLERGATSILLRIDRPSRAGVVVATLDDLDRALDGVRLDLAPVSLDAGPLAPAAGEMLERLWARRGHASGSVAGSFGIDPLGALAGEGTLAASLGDSLAALGRTAARVSRDWPHVRSVGVDTAAYYEAGANEVQDLAISMATALAYLRAMTEAGMAADAAARQIEFGYAVGVDVFQAMAKLRAARKLWARILAVLGLPEAERVMRQHVVTAERWIAGRDVWVNMLRATVATFAAGVGGADSLTVLPYDHAAGLPDNFARRIARNTQVILMEESGLHRVADPAGGSWYVERLTEEFAARAWTEFQGIEAEGGMAEALRSGRIGAEIEKGWAERERNLARRRDEITGVSAFPNLAEETARGLAVDAESLRRAARARAKPAGEFDLSSVEGRRRAIDAGVGLDTLAPLAGDTFVPLARHKLGEGFERLREASDRFFGRHRTRPRVFTANLGTAADYTARATFTANYMAAGGIECRPAETDANRVASDFAASGATFAVICSSDTIYADQAATVAEALKRAGAVQVWLAGRPGEQEAVWRAAGIDGFIFAGDDTLATLRRLHADLGVTEP